MWNSFQPFFKWHDHTLIGDAISGTVWAFPVIETIHILALTMMYAGMIIVNLRLVGLGMRKQGVPSHGPEPR